MWLCGVALFVAFVAPSIVLGSVVIEMWRSSPSQRSWLILGLGFYIVAALQAIYSAFTHICERMLYLRTEVRSTSASTLFEAVTAALEGEAEKSGATCSWDMEARQEHNSVTGDFSVKLRFWSARPRTVRLCVLVGGAPGQCPQRLHLHVQYAPGEDVVCGRDAHLLSRATLVLSTRTTADRALQDKVLLCRWFEDCYTKWTKPVDGVVKIYALQESSSDWVPEWKFEREKACKSTSGTGQAFYLQRSNLPRILVDARLWAGASLRVYMIAGPPGVGKSEFVVWLASQLALPIFRLCLSSHKLTDDRLGQLLSHTAICENAVLVQVDEFQETVERWLGSPERTTHGVSPGGFCEVVQGSTAMARGVMVLSGTAKIIDEQVQRQLAAVFRRIHCTACLDCMSDVDIRNYFRQFLRRFVPSTTDEEWADREAAFVDGSGPWCGAWPISIDMLKQYLMHQITEASCAGWGSFGAGVSQTFQVHPEKRAEFFALICSGDKARSFLNGYAPIA